jgi:hypothetical protein
MENLTKVETQARDLRVGKWRMNLFLVFWDTRLIRQGRSSSTVSVVGGRVV